MKLLKVKAATSQRVRFLVKNQATGLGVSSLAYNSSGLSVYYHRAGDTASTPVTLCAGTLGSYVNSGGTGTGGGLAPVDNTNMPGLYELSMPDACWAGGDPIIYPNVPSGTFSEPLEYEMTGADVTIAPGTAGGALTFGTGAGQLNLAAGNLAGPVPSVAAPVTLPATPPAGYGGSTGGTAGTPANTGTVTSTVSPSTTRFSASGNFYHGASVAAYQTVNFSTGANMAVPGSPGHAVASIAPNGADYTVTLAAPLGSAPSAGDVFTAA